MRVNGLAGWLIGWLVGWLDYQILGGVVRCSAAQRRRFAGANEYCVILGAVEAGTSATD